MQTMERCIEITAKGDIPTLLAMAHQPDNEAKVVALVALNIAALDEFLHLNNRLTEQEIDMVASDVVHVYGGALSFADLNIILTNARRGVYGRFYERLSGSDILSWVADYYEQRLNECATRTRYEHESRGERQREKGVTLSDAAFRIFKEQLQHQQQKNS